MLFLLLVLGAKREDACIITGSQNATKMRKSAKISLNASDKDEKVDGERGKTVAGRGGGRGLRRRRGVGNSSESSLLCERG
jgi:hypothetical protein